MPSHAPVGSLAYSPDGKFLAAAGNGEVLLIDVANGDIAAKLPGQGPKITAIVFNKDGSRLAVAGGAPGQNGFVRLYALNPQSPPTGTMEPVQTIDSHKDLIHDLAFSPDGKVLATCSYDRLVKLWDVATGKEIRALKDHSDAVYGVAFRPDGKLLATVSADRAVKVWDITTGARLYTLSESTDWLYTVAWSPDGSRVAAAGVDKSIRVWEVNEAGGKMVHSAFAHEGPVIRLVYSADGKTIYSLGEDRTIKSWEAARLGEGRVYPRQAETVLALAVRPDHQQIALGRFDGVVILLEEATGKVQAEPLPIKPKPPELAKLQPAGGPRGQTIRVQLTGKHLDTVSEIISSYPGVVAKIVEEKRLKDGGILEADITFPAQTPIGSHQLRVKNAVGVSAPESFTVDPFRTTNEKETNDSTTSAQPIVLSTTVVGTCNRTGDLDCFRFQATVGQEVGVHAVVVGSKCEPMLRLADANGTILAERTDGVMGFRPAKTGIYVLSIRDREFRGGNSFFYRLHIGDIPVITSVFPLGVQRGTEKHIALEGVHLAATTVAVKVPMEAHPESAIPLTFTGWKDQPAGKTTVVAGAFAQIDSADGVIPIPGTTDGIIRPTTPTQTWRFSAKKGQRLILETHASRIGTALDSTIDILDAKAQPLPRATLRSLTKTVTVLRDHDSAMPGIRLDSCAGMSMRDYALIGNDLLRVHTLPNYNDEDCQFFSVGGRRHGFFDSTPSHHALGSPLYKVEVHPPGTTFPPNGYPVFTVYYRNDDGGPGYSKDSRIFFDPPADGEYSVRVGDARGTLPPPAPPSQGGDQGGDGYRLTIRAPQPSFNVSLSPPTPAVPKGGSAPITVSVDRIDGYDGDIDVQLENLPPGFSAPKATIHSLDNTATLGLTAEPNATVPMNSKPFKVVAKAKVAVLATTTQGANAPRSESMVVREAVGGLPTIKDPVDISASTPLSEITIQPGSAVQITINIERKNAFKGRVPVETRGLPYGVRLLNVGLNGVLITPNETTRTFTIYAEPWVEPMVHPFVLVAKHEGKGTEHPTKPLLVKVVRPNNTAAK